MNSSPPGATRFAFGASLRAAIISSLAFAGLAAAQRHLYATSLVLAALLLVVMLDLARTVRAADRTFAQFAEIVGVEGHDRPVAPAGFQDFALAIRTTLDRLAELRAARQKHSDFLEALVDTVSAALLAVDQDGMVIAINRAARINLNAGTGPLAAVEALGGASAHRLLELPLGAREIFRLANRQAALVQVSGFSAPGIEGRLIALQMVANDLGAVETKAWQDLTRVLAHEMLNSLTPICSLSESIALRLRTAPRDVLSDELVGDAEVIARRGEGLMHFVERYRRLTELPPAITARLRARDILHRLDRLVAAMIGDRGIAYESCASPGDLSLIADPDLLDQALINLVKNALDAVSGLPDARVTVRMDVEEDQLTISVLDNGPGLPSADPESAFVPFYTTKAGGSGIGLALARQIALRHGGRLEYGTGTPHGALFRLMIPAG